MTDTKPLWKENKAKPDSPYRYADWDRLAKEEPNTVLLLQKEERYTNKDDHYQYWVNYHQKYGWSVSRKQIAPKSEDGDYVEDTHPEAKPTDANSEPIPAKNGTFEYRKYWENRQAFEEEKHKEIKKQHMENILLGNELKNKIEALTKVLEKIESGITSLALAYAMESKKT